MKKFSVFIVLLICAANFCCAQKNKTYSTDNYKYATFPNGTIVDARIPEDLAVRMIKRIEAIENGDLTAFRSTLGEMQDGVDFYYQLGLIYTFFGDFFDIDSDDFNEAVTTGEESLKIAETLFNSEHPLRNRNTGLFIRKMEITDTGGLMLIVMNNKNEKLIYNFTYY